jgi:hypothetical protein
LGAFDEELIMCEDDELWLRLAVHSEIDGIDEPLTVVRRHEQHSGDDTTAWRDRRRVFEKALRTSSDARLCHILRRLRAEMSAGLAQSQAAAGRRVNALGTLLSSVHYSWRYPQWWSGALGTTARALTPAGVRKVVHRLRGRRRVQVQPHA